MANVTINRTATLHNLNPQLIQQIANAVTQQVRADLNQALKGGVFQQGGTQGLNTAKMAQAYPAQKPSANLAAAQTFDLRALGKGAQRAAKQGFGVSGLQGALVEAGVGKGTWRFWNTNHRAEAFEKRLKNDPAFRKQVEARTNGKFIPDGRNDGKVTFAPLQVKLPGISATTAQVHSSLGNTGLGVLGGISQMQNSAVQLMLGMNPALSGQLGGGGLNMSALGAGGLGAAALGGGTLATLGLAGGGGGGGIFKNALLGAFTGGDPMAMDGLAWKMRSSFGMTRTQGGPGSAVAKLGPGASFEDLVAAFMVDTIHDQQQEAKAKMNEIKRSINSKNSLMGKVRGALGGLASTIGSVGGLMIGGPIGMMAGGALGGAVGGVVGGGQNAGADSRNLMFEELKNIMQKLQQMLQALSNVINTMHQGAMNSIRNIRA